MSSINTIVVDKLARLIGTPRCPIVIDCRTAEDYAADPRLIPSSVRREHAGAPEWERDMTSPAVVVCQQGRKLSQGVAAWLRATGVEAESLDGGYEAWLAAGQPVVNTARLPPRNTAGQTVWVTRERPKVDRVACPWLIRRFIDTSAVFLFVSPAEVEAVASRFSATPFDVEGVFWSHRGETCTFDTMIEEFALKSAPLLQLAKIVRGADTARPDLTPQSEGLLAASLGYSRMYRDDLPQLEAAMGFYDAFYRWCRDATEETHNWPSTKPKA